MCKENIRIGRAVDTSFQVTACVVNVPKLVLKARPDRLSLMLMTDIAMAGANAMILIGNSPRTTDGYFACLTAFSSSSPLKVEDYGSLVTGDIYATCVSLGGNVSAYETYLKNPLSEVGNP